MTLLARRAALLSAVAVAAACGARGSRRDDAAPAASPQSATPPDEGEGATDREEDRSESLTPTPGATTGDVLVKVVWANAPASHRSSPGLGPCGHAIRPPVQVHTLGGVADVAVVVVGGPEKGADANGGNPRQLHTQILDCAAHPRLIVTSGPAVLTTSLLEPGPKTVNVRGLSVPGLATGSAKTISVALPVIGHRAQIDLGTSEALVLDVGTDSAHVLALGHKLAAVSDETGAARITGVAPGEHTVVAWLPARSSGSERRVQRTVAVVAGRVVEVTLDLAEADR